MSTGSVFLRLAALLLAVVLGFFIALQLFLFSRTTTVSEQGTGERFGTIPLLNGYFLVGSRPETRTIRRNPALSTDPLIPPQVVALAIEGDSILAICIVPPQKGPQVDKQSAGGAIALWSLNTVTGATEGPTGLESLGSPEIARFADEQLCFQTAESVFRAGRYTHGSDVEVEGGRR